MRKLQLLHFLHLTVKIMLKSLLNILGFYILYQNHSNEKKELQESRQNDALLYYNDAHSMELNFTNTYILDMETVFIVVCGETYGATFWEYTKAFSNADKAEEYKLNLELNPPNYIVDWFEIYEIEQL